MTRIAIPVSGGVLSNRLIDCTHFEVFDIDNKIIIDQFRYNGSLREVSDLSNWIVKESITDVIVHYIDKLYVNYFINTKVNLYLGISILTPEKLIEAYLKGTLRSDTKDFFVKNNKEKN